MLGARRAAICRNHLANVPRRDTRKGRGIGRLGSRRRPWGAKRWTVEEALALDVRRLARSGGLTRGRHVHRWPSLWGTGAEVAYEIAEDGETLTLEHRIVPHPLRGGKARDVAQAVSIVRTPCRFGGDRPWFACPACDRHVVALYHLALLADDFRCRHCLGLAYASTREDSTRRLLRKADRLRADLGGAPGRGGIPPQPVHMGWHAYWRKVDRIEELEHAYAARVAPEIDARLKRLQDQES